MTTGARSWVFAASLIVIGARAGSANELWVAPTLQQDVGGLGVGTGGVWPTTPAGTVRLAWAIPDNLKTFQSAKVVLIAHTSTFGANLVLHVCTAKSSDAVAGGCSFPLTQAFTSVADELLDVDISALIAPRIGTPGRTYLSVLASSTVADDRILGLRFEYTPTIPAGVAVFGANSFTGAQTAPSFVGSGAQLTDVAKLTANTFTGTQTVPDLNITGKLGVVRFDPLGTLQIGPSNDALFRFEPAPFSPWAGVIRFGDRTGWNLVFSRSRNVSGGPLLNGADGPSLMRLLDNTGSGGAVLTVGGSLAAHSGQIRFTLDTFGPFLSTTGGVTATLGSRLGFTIRSRDVLYFDSGGVGHSLSSRAVKHDFRELDFADILTRIERLPMMEWSYRDQDPAIRHIGPFAEDFHALFGLGGDDDTRISSVDPSGVALAGIKALAGRLHALDREIEAQWEQLQEQARQIEALNALVISGGVR